MLTYSTLKTTRSTRGRRRELDRNPRRFGAQLGNTDRVGRGAHEEGQLLRQATP